jgi:serine/threonine-protein kinase
MPDGPKRYQIFFAELKRRQVFKVAAVYGAVAFGVLQAADIAFPRMGLPDWTVTFVVALVALGLPIAIVLAWALEMTPGGVRKTDPAKTGELEAIVALPRGRRWPVGLLAAAAIVLMGVSVWWVFREAGETGRRGAESATVRSIAVLPFVNMSDDPGNEYFSDGLAEELINVLTEIKGLKVAARTSAFSFKGKNADVGEIGEALGVANVLEGSVRKSGDRVRIAAQLIQTSDGFHLWSETYDRQLDDIFAIQEEIADAIADEMELTLGSEGRDAVERRRTDDLAAYDLYLLGRHNWATRTESGLIAARRYFEQAIERDPMFARAWAGLANVYNALPWWTDFPADEAASQGKAAALRAIELDPQLGEAYAALAVMTSEFEWGWEEAERQFRRALELDPDYSSAHLWYGQLLTYLGRFAEASQHNARSLELDPLSMLNNYAAGTLHAFIGRFDEAFALYERSAEIEPSANVLFEHAGMLVVVERYSDAADVYEHWAETAVFEQPELARELVAGVADDSRRRGSLDALEELSAGIAVDPFNWVAPLVQLGESEQAVTLLERLYDGRSPTLVSIGTDPRLDPLRRNPRFIRIVEGMGLPNGGPTYTQ